MNRRPAFCRRAFGVRVTALSASRLVQIPGLRSDRFEVDAPRWHPRADDQLLMDLIRDRLPSAGATVCIAVEDLETGVGIALNADLVVPPASLFKINIMVTVMRDIESGRLKDRTTLVIEEEDWAPGAGNLQFRIGETVTVREALTLMMNASDNTASFVLLRAVTQRRLNDLTRSFGMHRTHFYVDERPDETSAGDVATILQRIATGDAAGPQATADMLSLMSRPQSAAWIRGGLPRDVLVAHKSGQLQGIRNDAAIITTKRGRYICAILVSDLDNDPVGEEFISAIAPIIYRHLVSS